MRAHQPAAVDGAWQYCASPGCEVLFFLDDQLVLQSDAAARVGTKAPDAPEPVCFCFAHTADQVAVDLFAHGTSTVKASIKDAVARGDCACKDLNPAKRCCLGDVNRTIKIAAALRPPEPAQPAGTTN